MKAFVTTRIVQAKSLDEFRHDNGNGKRRLGMVYYQALEDGGCIVRTITEQTDVNLLQRLLQEGKLYRAKYNIISEMG